MMQTTLPTESNTPRLIQELAMQIIQKTGSMTADDLHEALPGFRGDRRAFGAALRELARQGHITKAGYVASKRRECHNRPILVWVKA